VPATFDDIVAITRKQGILMAMENMNNKYREPTINLGVRLAVKIDLIAFAHIPRVKANEYLNQ